MDIRQLQYFSRVVEMGSFSRAAAYLHVAQPALSRQIRALEIELKESLLIRNGRGVTPTEAGERLHGHARGILKMLARTYEDMENARQGRAGSVSLGMPTSLSNSISLPLIGKLKNELPDAKVHILNGRSNQIQEWILSGQLDMAVLFDAPASPMLEIHEVHAESLHLYEVLPEEEHDVIGPDFSLNELAELPIIITSRPNRVRELLENALAREGHKLLVECELDSLETTFQMIQKGMGVTVATPRSRRTVNSAAKGLRMRKIVKPEILLKVQIVLPVRRLNNRLHEAAFELLYGLCSDLLRP
ncbi:LysR family nitrogen assimilation transcriptional regulator [Pseudorhizobium tarimense]|uniref:LysR family nitrogen assimilation transcriptional regulator n=1 Tax=Pseudorhizobium tarimense TaxID=1079109 RepID=A0ABV2HBZ5_9HYPH|nr:LysR substrate-binding domain-containing protein [Pseudorhizobium tarimense]MCJ8520916.1 LysR substrate-binding domain-containing protein [Pseudorhizobium tarimense]